MKKKAAAFIAAAVMLFGAGAVLPGGTLIPDTSITASAASDVRFAISPSSASLNRGDEFSVDLSITQNPGINGFMLLIDYDTTALELTGCEFGNMLSGALSSKTESGSPLVIVWQQATSAALTKTGTAATLKFKVKSTAAAGKYTIRPYFENTAKPSVFKTEGNSSSSQNVTVPCTLSSGTVEIGKPSVKVTPGDGSLTLSWGAVPGAEQYSVTRYEGGSYKYVGTTKNNSYTVTGLTNGTKYTYLVQAQVGGKWSTYTTADHVTAAPEIFKPVTTASATGGKVTLRWTAVPNAQKYAISRYENGRYKTITTEYTGTSVTMGGHAGGTTYQYLVQAYKYGSWSPFTANDLATVFVPVKPNVQPGDGKAVLSWNAVDGATSYAVSKYENGRYTTLTTSVTGTSYTVNGLTNGKTYQFLVQANVNKAWTTFTGEDLVSVTPQSVKPKVTATAGNSKVTLRWNAVPGAAKYAVSRYENGRYKTITTEYTGTSINVGALANGRIYEFLVQAYVNGAWTTFTDADRVSATLPNKPGVSAFPDSSGTKVTLRWAPVEGAEKYAICRCYKIDGKYKYFLFSDCYPGTSITFGQLTPGNTYKYLVQAWVDGAWTTYTEDDITTVTMPVS